MISGRRRRSSVPSATLLVFVTKNLFLSAICKSDRCTHPTMFLRSIHDRSASGAPQFVFRNNFAQHSAIWGFLTGTDPALRNVRFLELSDPRTD
jgi:hypothetical protein